MKRRLRSGFARARLGQDLDRDKAVQPGVLGPVNVAHATGTQLLEELIMKNCSPDHTTPPKCRTL